MLRLFTGLSIPDHIAETLLPLQTNLVGARWRPRENFHITLKFYGEVNQGTASKLQDALSEIRFEPFEISLKGSGWFGGKKPQSVWVGVETSEPLDQLHLECTKAARVAGLSLGQQRYTPHITLAYCRTSPTEQVVGWVTPLADFDSAQFYIEEFYLYSSTLGSKPSTYQIQASYH